jgi:hypothetical protein
MVPEDCNRSWKMQGSGVGSQEWLMISESIDEHSEPVCGTLFSSAAYR